MKQQTQDAMRAEAIALFGEDVRKWRFVCPNCNDVAAIEEFVALDAVDKAGQECIGRYQQMPSVAAGRGCDWTAYGLINGPVAVRTPMGTTIYRFRFDGEPEEESSSPT